MYQILPETSGHLIGLKATGTLTTSDFEVLQSEIDRLLAQAAPACVLLDWTELHGWDARGEQRAFTFWLGAWSQIDKVAVIAEETFLSDVVQLGVALSHSTVRHFYPGEAGSARAWLAGA